MRARMRWFLLGTLLVSACAVSPDEISPGSGGRILPPPSKTGSGGAGASGGGSAGENSGGGGENAGNSSSEGGASGQAQAGDAGAGGSAEAGQAGGAGEGGAGGGVSGAAGNDAGGVGGAAGTAGAAGVGGGGSGGNPTAPEDKDATLAHLTIPCDHPLDASFYEAATAPSPWSSGERGGVARCGYDRLISLNEIKSHLSTAGSADVPVFSGIHRLRVVYWTEDTNGEPVLTSATLFLPVQRIAEGAAPLVVLAHGSVGVADKCAPSREDAEGFHNDWRTLAYSLAGQGWVALMPDYVGLGTPGTHAWQLSPEEGHALLDATRSARKLAKPGFFSAKNSIVGHSQGGHAAISAHSFLGSYGAEGEINSVVAFAPVWFSQASWGALMTSTAVALKLNSASALASSVLYFAGHAARLDGEDKVADLFAPEKTADIESFLLGQCWQDITDPAKWPASLQPALTGSPGKGGGEFYSPTYVSKVGSCGLTGSCADPLAATWRARWAQDRPTPDSKTPLVIWGGDLDESVAPGRLQCGLDRLKAQGAPLTACAAKGADHATVLVAANAWVHGHLQSVLLGTPAPAACPDYGTEIPTKCATPPVNSLNAQDP